MFELNPEWSIVLAKLFSLQLIVAIALVYALRLHCRRGVAYAAVTWIGAYALILVAQSFHHLLP